jgi:5-(carboxyamino)imidazole ribonucleotide mutase
MSNKNLIKPQVAIIMGSDSDYEIMKEAEAVLKDFGVEFQTSVVSAHRTPEKMFEFAKSALDNGFKVIIAGAGGSAHLPGMVAAMTVVPVIGVPIKSKNLKGLDSLYSIVQMPPGIPVATMAINGSKNAALMAIQMLAMNDEKLLNQLQDYRKEMENKVLEKSTELFGV